MSDGNLSFVPTRCSTLKNIAVQYQEVVYENPSKKKTKSNPIDTDKQLPNSLSSYGNNDQEYDVKRLKYEIKKFAKCNGKSLNKQKTYRELAIELGAKPYRRNAIPYKELLEKKKKQKQKDEKKLIQIASGKELNRQKKKKKKPDTRDRSGFLDFYGKVTSQNNTKDVRGKNRR